MSSSFCLRTRRREKEMPNQTNYMNVRIGKRTRCISDVKRRHANRNELSLVHRFFFFFLKKSKTSVVFHRRNLAWKHWKEKDVSFSISSMRPCARNRWSSWWSDSHLNMPMKIIEGNEKKKVNERTNGSIVLFNQSTYLGNSFFVCLAIERVDGDPSISLFI